MKRVFSTSWFLPALVLLCGCGGGYSGSSNTPPPTSGPPAAHAVNISGNWQFSTTSLTGMAPATIAGGIDQSDSSISGTVHFDGSKCFDRLAAVRLTGNLTGRDITLTSTPFDGEVVTFTASVSDDALNGSDSAITGTYIVTGGCADADHGNFTGLKIPVIANTLNGTFTSSGGATFELAGSEAQFGPPDSEGSFGIEGQVHFATSCFGSGAITPGTLPSGSFIIGSSVALEIKTENGTVTFLGTLNRQNNQISGTYTVSGGTCAQTGTGLIGVSGGSGTWDY